MRRCRRIRECPRRSSPRPHFFKIVIKAILESGELIIPREFTRQYAKKVGDVAFLKVPTGRKWQVEVKRVDGSVRFQNGWRGFMEDHSISIGYFLVFRYDGNSTFSVCIFNQGACEIDYPSDSDEDIEEFNLHTELLIPVKKEPKEEDPVEPMNVFPSFQPLPSSAEEVLDKAQEIQITKRGRGRPRKRRNSEHPVEPLDAFPSFQPLSSSAEEVPDKGQELGITKRKRGRPRKRRSSEDPVGPLDTFPSFQPLSSYTEEVLDKSQELRITRRGRPRGSCSPREQRRNIKHEEPRELGDGSGLNGIKGKSPIFDAENEMELVEVSSHKAQEQRINKRGRPRGSCSAQKKRRNRKHQEIRELDDGSGLNGIKVKSPIFDAETEMEAIEVSSDNPNNETSMSTSTDTTSLSMGDNAQHQKTSADNSLPLVPRPSLGDLSLQFNRSEPSLSAPATQEVESFCSEQECRSKEFTAKSSTSAAEPDAGIQLDSLLTKDEENVNLPSSQRYRKAAATRRLAIQQREKAIFEAQMYKTKNPYVMIIMKPSYVGKGTAVNFPKLFAKKYLSHGLHSVKVSVSDGRTWMVRLFVSQHKAMISGGWRKFVQDNNLKVGDCCVFEVSEAKVMELKISIFHVFEEAKQELKI